MGRLIFPHVCAYANMVTNERAGRIRRLNPNLCLFSSGGTFLGIVSEKMSKREKNEEDPAVEGINPFRFDFDIPWYRYIQVLELFKYY